MTDSPYTLAQRIDGKKMATLDAAILEHLTMFTKAHDLTPDEGIEVVARWLGVAQLVGGAHDVARAVGSSGLVGKALSSNVAFACETMVSMGLGSRVAFQKVYADAIGVTWPPAAPATETVQ
jgi:hypothetical protein